MNWFWLSFADANLPEGSQFLGGAIVQAKDARATIVVAADAGCNPGGGVQIQYVARNQPNAVYVVLERWRDRLLTREQSEQIGRELHHAGCIPLTDKDIN